MLHLFGLQSAYFRPVNQLLACLGSRVWSVSLLHDDALGGVARTQLGFLFQQLGALLAGNTSLFHADCYVADVARLV